MALVDCDLHLNTMERERLTGHMSVLACSLDVIDLVG
jgi:hypothetical protein